ncbi:MAG TPA: M17 family peptidase N-terminal domain-containing protein, partial [Xanthobacteraceae bacterium]
MSGTPKISFSEPKPLSGGTFVILADENLHSGRLTRRALEPSRDLVSRAARTEGFKGKKGKVLDLVAPSGLKADRLIVLGLGKLKEIGPGGWAKLGGGVMGKIAAAKNVTVLFEFPEGAAPAEAAADFAFGMRLRAYRFDRYKTKKKDGEDKNGPSPANVTVALADPAAARKKWNARGALARGVEIARDLVNEPPNVLFPVEFARRASTLEKLGVAVDILDVSRMKKLGMGALLGVGQGSAHEPRLVVMRWDGGKKGDKPAAIVGKGVCFDTGGISIKPAGGMEDMK